MLMYIKFCTIFILIELLITFIFSFFNLIGLNSSISFIMLFISNLILFFIYGLINGKANEHKGFIEGIITSSILILILFIISLIFFIKSLSIYTIFYYLVLMISCVIGAIIGKNKKDNSTQLDKK